MVIDSSAIISILLQEPGHELLRELIFESFQPLEISAPTLLETSIVIDNRSEWNGVSAIGFCELGKIKVIEFDLSLVEIAKTAYQTYGRGSGHPAQLNFADCFSYALAKQRNDSLLFVGNDFIHTDIRSAL